MRIPSICLAPALLLAGCSCSSNPANPDMVAGEGHITEGLFFPDGRGAAASEQRGDHAASADDFDGDGLTNAEEDKLHTNKWSKDTDGDGEDDLSEVGSASAPKDGDADGRLDALEPSNFDTDKDGTSDEADKDANLCNGTPRVFVLATYSDQNLSLVKACSPYRVMGFLWMTGERSLSIAAGVKVELGPEASIILGDNTTKASLSSTGLIDDKVFLTSLATTPKKGDWRGIVAQQATSIALTHTTVQWAGAADSSGDPKAAIYVKAAQQISLNAVTIEHSGGAGLHAAFYTDPGPLFPTFTGCKLTDLTGAAAVLNIRHLGEIGAGNDFAAAGTGSVILVNEGVVAKDAVWKAVGIPYELEEKTIVVDANLSIEAGVKVIVQQGAYFDVANGSAGTGSLTTKGTSATSTSGVTIQTASPSPGSWIGLMLMGGSNSLSYTTLRGAGWVNQQSVNASIYLAQEANLKPTAVTISESDGFGVYYYRSGYAPLGGCSFVNGTGYTLSGTFPGNANHPGCKFLCQDDGAAKCIVGP